MKGSKEARTMTKRVGSRKLYEPLIMFGLSISSYNTFDQNWNIIDDCPRYIHKYTPTIYLKMNMVINQMIVCPWWVGGQTK